MTEISESPSYFETATEGIAVQRGAGQELTRIMFGEAVSQTACSINGQLKTDPACFEIVPLWRGWSPIDQSRFRPNAVWAA